MGLFPSHPDAPRMIVTNGMTIPNYSSMSDYEKYFFLGTSQYGQMTAGSFCYIGPQGIVHGTTITVAEAGRKYFGWNDLRGKVYVTAGLGGMSGAQAKAAVINNVIGVCAELSEEALMKRYNQGWLTEYSRDLEEVMASIKKYRAEGVGGVSIGYLGNVVDLWERLAEEEKDATFKLTCVLGLLSLGGTFIVGHLLELHHIHRLPEAAVGLIFGLVLSGAAYAVGNVEMLTAEQFDFEFFMTWLLPPIIFEAGYNIEDIKETCTDTLDHEVLGKKRAE